MDTLPAPPPLALARRTDAPPPGPRRPAPARPGPPTFHESGTGHRSTILGVGARHREQGASGNMKSMALKTVLLVVCLSITFAAPATAQLGDPLSLAASGVLLPFFSDPAAGFVSIFELTSPVVPTTTGTTFPFDFTNPLHAVFFNATCARDGSAADVFTAKQAKAYISSAPTFLLNFNGLAAIAAAPNGNDLSGRTFPFHARTHWI